MRSTRYSVTTIQILDETIKNVDVDPLAAIDKSKISQVAAWLAAEIPNLNTSKLTTGLLPLARGGLATALALAGNTLKVIRVNAGETALELATVGGIYSKLDRVIQTVAGASLSTNTFAAKDILKIIIWAPEGAGTRAVTIRFGSAGTIDAGTNYDSHRWNAGVREISSAQNRFIFWPDTTVDANCFFVLHVINFATFRKLVFGGTRLSTGHGGECSGNWNDITNRITNVQIIATPDGGTDQQIEVDSQIEVYGRNFND